MAWSAIFLVLAIAGGLADGLASTDTITWGGDNSRTGYQTGHNLDPATVASSQFGQIFQTILPGNYLGRPEVIFSQPLVYTPSNDTSQYVYWLTTQNNVYKTDAATGKILLSRSVHIPFQQADLDGCPDLAPYVGITGTGVIDPDTDTLYFASKTYVNQTSTAPQGRPAGRYYIHAVDVNDLSERPNFPIDLEGLVPRNSPTRSFNGGIQLQRPGLVHVGQYIYAGFGSHCVQYNFTGWLIGWDKTSGEIVEHWATEGEGIPNDIAGGALWMSGGGIASDDASSLYFATGNGYSSQLSTIPVNGHNPPAGIEEAACHVTINEDGSTTLVDFFIPQNKQVLDGDDKDLGVTPLQLLPSEFSCGPYEHIGVVTDKLGLTYFLDLDDLGGYRNGPDSGDDVIASFQNNGAVYSGAGVYPLKGGGGYIYINVVGQPTNVFEFSCDDGVPAFTLVAQSLESSANTRGVSHGTVTTMNGQVGSGLYWVTDLQGATYTLRIYNALPQNGVLVMVNSFQPSGITKFTRAVFGDGRLYLGSTEGHVYGFGAPTTEPLNCTGPIGFGNVNIGSLSASMSMTCTAVVGMTVDAISLPNGTQYELSNAPSLPLKLVKGQSFSFLATFSPSSVESDPETVKIGTSAVAGYTIVTSVQLMGTGVSQMPLLEVSPVNLTFSGVTTGLNPGGINQTAILANLGNSTLTIDGYAVSGTGADGSFVQGTSTGLFNFLSLPSSIAANAQDSIVVNFNSSQNGTFAGYLQVTSDGGSAVLAASAVSGGPPVTLIEFLKPDGGSWVQFDPSANFTFGNVTENTTRKLVMRVSNIAPAGSNELEISVSKPPFGIVGSIIGAANDVSLGEGSTIAAGSSQNATLYCSPPKAQWDTDSYMAYATWTFNDNDNNLGKHTIGFDCQAVSEQAAPLDATGQAVYRYAGCFKDNNPGRQLPHQLYSNENSTTAMCIAACAEAGYAYCATEYHVECWAGDAIPSVQVAEADCDFNCGGDLNQICGGNGVGTDEGGSYMSLFVSSGAANGSGPGGSQPSGGPVVNPGIDGYFSLGCYQEPTDGTRALANQLVVAPQTVDDCLNACAGMYAYVGLEYGGECWCDTKLSRLAVSVAAAQCTMACNGNNTELCGGPSLLNLYRSNNTLSSNSSSTATSTTSVTPPTAVPVVNPGVAGYSSLGCYHEPSGIRALTYEFDTIPQSVEACLTLCEKSTYTYAGLEYGGECWCDNTLNAGAYIVGITNCSMPCNGNSSELCGGSELLNLYSLTVSVTTKTATMTSVSASDSVMTTPATASSSTLSISASSTSISAPTSTGPVVNSGVDGYISLGCYTEATQGRALAHQLSTVNETVADCLDLCAGAYTYAGLEYGGECWCGNDLGVGAGPTDASACTMPCNDNRTELCGGPSLLNLYQSNATALPVGGPFINPGKDGFAYRGCYHEPDGGRALPNQQSVGVETVGACLDVCEGAYTFAGLEYGGECWCGNALSAGSAKEEDATCSMVCNGNQTEYCGGPVLLTVYERKVAS
jgi:hypothetical protein